MVDGGSGSVRKLHWGAVAREVCKPLEGLTPFEASGLAMRLGGLARWWLRREVLQLAAANDAIPSAVRATWRTPPALNPIHGSTWVVFATDEPHQRPLLRPAFVVPFKWNAHQDHSPLLPKSLVDLARTVVESIAPGQAHPGRTWGLGFAQDIGGLDAGDLPVECASGWAPLAAGLLVAVAGGKPDPRVWASGCWDWRDGIRRVDHLPAKIQLAVEWGAQWFFVPESQVEEAQGAAGTTGLNIGKLASGTRDPRAALEDYLWSLEVAPCLTEDPDSFRRCKDYFLRFRNRSTGKLDQYYRDHLLPRIVRNLRTQVERDWPGWNPSHLVTIVSGSPDVVRMCAVTLRVGHCLLLHTLDGGQRKLAERLSEELRSQGIACTLGPFSVSEHIEQAMRSWVGGFVAGVEPSQVAVDVTPGTKQMSIALARLAVPGSWIVYVRHRLAGDGRPEPGSEQLLRWRAEN